MLFRSPASGVWRHYPAIARPERVFAWAEPGRAYAGQIVKGRDGRFYLYAPVLQRDGGAKDRFAIGVAVAWILYALNPKWRRLLKANLAQAGYRDAQGKFDPSRFPVTDVDITYNTSESNRGVAEFVQAQWKQNLQITVPLKNMEFKTFLQTRARLEYRGAARGGWIGDYLDPFTFLSMFSVEGGDNGTGWSDDRFEIGRAHV